MTVFCCLLATVLDSHSPHSGIVRLGTRVFDLARDPGERTPLEPGTHPVAAALAKKVEAFAGRISPREAPTLDPELKKRLEALGYTDR